MSQPDQTTEHAARVYRRNAARCRMVDTAQDRIDNVPQLQARKGRAPIALNATPIAYVYSENFLSN
jgi:hypothetical protein